MWILTMGHTCIHDHFTSCVHIVVTIIQMVIWVIDMIRHNDYKLKSSCVSCDLK